MVLWNQCTFAGNLGGDPEVRYTESGTVVVNFRMAVSNRKKNRDSGQWEDDPMWVRVTGFGPTNEKLAKLLQKGSRVLVTGRLDTPAIFERQDGSSGVSVQMVADKIATLDRAETYDESRGPDEPPARAPQARPQAAPAQTQNRAQTQTRSRPASAPDDEDLQDLPF